MPFIVIDPNARPMLVVSEAPHSDKKEAEDLAQRYADMHGDAGLVEIRNIRAFARTIPGVIDIPPGPSRDAPQGNGGTS